MAPTEFFLRLQHGITGGFAPPTPSAVHSLSKSSAQTHILVASATRALGTPELSEAAPKAVALTATNAVDGAEAAATPAAALVDELQAILKRIPMESPPGSEDIYGMDTGIAWASADLEWSNGGPAGCAGGPGSSTVQPTAEDKAGFARAVEIVKELLATAQ
ncbi:hypothetical protein M0805_000627 [Coniferiporia weirii]|nr:hypothetical protein M0805_000627 [Coniferiporia weirii]